MDTSSQKQLGSYYTGADITEYISTATIIPFIFETAGQQCPAALSPDGPLWSLLREDPDRYIYHALKHGCALALPPEIAEGLDNVSRRQGWNNPAPGAYALPLETWREVVARRQHYAEMRARMNRGEICSVDDLITCNLDMRCFAREAIERCPDAESLEAFYTCIKQVSILDPTCGSGAFLLAALRVLMPLYEACLARMQSLLEEQTCQDETSLLRDCSSGSALAHFRAILQEAGVYPARRYSICRSIVEHNLYGVDIMPEAIENCKLSLSLMMGLHGQREGEGDAELERILARHLRVGNALVGIVKRDNQPSTEVLAFSRLAELDEELAAEYGVDRTRMEDEYAAELAAWRQNCRPFHWWAEFQEIAGRGGFDIIIGNPPYVSYKSVKAIYEVRDYATQSCANLYAYTLERALTLLRPGGRCGMVVPVSAISGESFRPLSKLLLQRQMWVSSYSNRPARLFADVEQRLAILLLHDVQSQSPALFSSPYRHWYEAERIHLFDRLTYVRASTWPHTGMPLKSGAALVETIFSRLLRQAGLPLLQCEQAEAAVWIHNGPTYWVRALPFEPNAGRKSARSNHYRKIPVSNQRDAFLLAAVLSSSIFYLFYKLVSNCRDLGHKELRHFPLGHVRPELAVRLASLGCSLAQRLKETAVQCSRRYPRGVIVYEEYYPATAKALIDRIDRVLAEHYGFTEEELDFIVNYVIKYRMGREDRP